jgi:hypothetical protein
MRHLKSLTILEHNFKCGGCKTTVIASPKGPIYAICVEGLDDLALFLYGSREASDPEPPTVILSTLNETGCVNVTALESFTKLDFSTLPLAVANVLKHADNMLRESGFYEETSPGHYVVKG